MPQKASAMMRNSFACVMAEDLILPAAQSARNSHGLSGLGDCNSAVCFDFFQAQIAPNMRPNPTVEKTNPNMQSIKPSTVLPGDDFLNTLNHGKHAKAGERRGEQKQKNRC